MGTESKTVYEDEYSQIYLVRTDCSNDVFITDKETGLCERIFFSENLTDRIKFDYPELFRAKAKNVLYGLRQLHFYRPNNIAAFHLDLWTFPPDFLRVLVKSWADETWADETY